MTLKVKIFGVLALILLITGGGIGVAVTKLISQGPELIKTEEQVDQVLSFAVPLLVSIKEIKADVILVQGWLTDISATRGLPGFDDGFAEAESFAAKFNADVGLSRKYAKTLELKEVLSALSELEAAFPPFYAGGKKMAQSYIDNGPEGGNPQMEVFDSVAERMGVATDTLIKVVEENVGATLTSLHTQTEDVRESNETLVLLLIVLSSIAAITMAGGVIYLHRTITRSFTNLNDDVAAVMSESESITLSLDPDQRDEFGPIASALYAFQDNKIKANQMRQERRKAQKEQTERARKLEEMAGKFDGDVRSAMDKVKSASDTMKTTAEGMSSTTDEANAQATVVAAAAEQASTNVQTVASAAEQLSSSVHEISRQVAQSSEIAHKAVSDATHTDRQIQGLAEAANKIGAVVALITDIADQTNLLALNATIEAARAGDAGKGFAVVASEVKNLANQTSKATEEIGNQVSNIQSATEDAVVAIQGIGKTIGEIDEIATVIAAAVQEQGAATQEIARNVEQAATGTQEVSSNISGVNHAVGKTGQAASNVVEVVGTLSQQSDDVSRHVEEFLNGIRAI